MTNDERAVRERLVRITDWENPAEVYGGPDYEHDYSEDCTYAVQRWLEATAADDHLEATPEWLLEQKEWRVRSEDTCLRIESADPKIDRENSGSWWIGGTRLWRRQTVTRSMVRRLVAALRGEGA